MTTKSSSTVTGYLKLLTSKQKLELDLALTLDPDYQVTCRWLESKL